MTTACYRLQEAKIRTELATLLQKQSKIWGLFRSNFTKPERVVKSKEPEHISTLKPPMQNDIFPNLGKLLRQRGVQNRASQHATLCARITSMPMGASHLKGARQSGVQDIVLWPRNLTMKSTLTGHI
eukprot:5324023-Amphidinium_carterae.1